MSSVNKMSIGHVLAMISNAANQAKKGDIAGARDQLENAEEVKTDLREQLSELKDKAEGYRDADPGLWDSLWGAEARNLRRLAYTSNRITSAQEEMATQDEALEAARTEAQDSQEVFTDSMKVVEDMRGHLQDVGHAVDQGVLG